MLRAQLAAPEEVDAGLENQRPTNARRAKSNITATNASIQPRVSLRPALGTITNNLRVQPKRKAKNGAGCAEGKPTVDVDENPAGFPKFQIYCETSQDLVESKKSQCESETAVVRHPLSTLNINRDDSASKDGHTISVRDFAHVKPDADSPMVLDTSKTEDKNAKGYTNIFHIPEYEQAIYDYLREFELKHRPKPFYMKKQPDITHSMRSILVDWLIEVTEEYKLHSETLFMTVCFIDRFLSSMSVVRGKLQLVGTACIFIASKYEEIYAPEVDEFVYITDDTYTKKQVLRMEQVILKVLAFDVSVPTIPTFLQRFIHIGRVDLQTQHLALYLCELSLLEAEPYLKYIPSIVAGAALCLACMITDNEIWDVGMQTKTGYTMEDFKECMTDLFKSFKNAAQYPQQAVREKYKSPKFCQVALLDAPSELPF